MELALDLGHSALHDQVTVIEARIGDLPVSDRSFWQAVKRILRQELKQDRGGEHDRQYKEPNHCRTRRAVHCVLERRFIE